MAGTLRTDRRGQPKGFLGGGMGKSTMFGSRAFGTDATGGGGGWTAASGVPVGMGAMAGHSQLLGIGDWKRQARQRQAAGAGGAALQGAVGQYNRAFGQARTANEQRYQQMLQIADQDYAQQGRGYQQMMSTIGQETGQRAADIRSETEGLVSQEQQRMSRLGLSNVSQPSVYAGIRREGQSNLNRLTDQLLGRKLGVQQQIAQRGRGTRLGIMERREDAYPDSNMLLALTQQLGSIPGMDYSALGRMRV